MSKELIKIIRQEIEDLTDTHYEPKRTEDIDKAMKVIEPYLIPPTKEEVCKALSKWVKGNIPDIWNYKVYYDREGFHYYNNCDFEEYLVEYEQIGKAITLSVFLPPHLITLIGRFYEELEEVEE